MSILRVGTENYRTSEYCTYKLLKTGALTKNND